MIVSVDELRDYMSGIGLDADQTRSAEDVLRGLQRQLERYCQRPLERRSYTEQLMPDEAGRLWPAATPISSVSSPVGVYPLPGNALGGYSALNLIGSGAIEVTYVGGLVGEDEHDVRVAILRAAARELTVRHDDTLSPADLGARQTQPVDRKDPGFTADELAQFDRLRRRTVV